MPLEELPPASVAELRRLRGRADDVREENRGEDAVGLALLPPAGLPHLLHEPADLALDELCCRPAEGEVADSGNLDETCRRNVRSDVARNVDRDDRVLGAVQDERRDTHRRQDVPDVDVLVHPVKGFDRAGARAEAEHLEKRVRLRVGELPESVDRLSRLLTRPEDLPSALHLAFVLLFRLAPRVIRRPHPARKRAADDERRGPLRIRRREENAHGRSLGQAVERGAP